MYTTSANPISGFVEVCIMHPLDLVKTRFQIQRGVDDPTRYKSIVDCFKTMYRTEGCVKYDGIKAVYVEILATLNKVILLLTTLFLSWGK